MTHFICPVCGAGLQQQGKSLCCASKHNFDLAKEGYVNLYTPGKSGGVHGDDKLMVRSRRDFLNKGYYQPLLQQLTQEIVSRCNSGDIVLDAGCGECWYTSHIEQALQQAGITVPVLGVDISKNALAAGAKRNAALQLAVASVFHLPVADETCHLLLNVFAPFCHEDFLRVLAPDGYLVMAVPLEEHLWELKQAVYDQPYRNQVKDWALDGFRLETVREIREHIHLPCQEDIWNLFTMTPYYYKTGMEDQNKLRQLTQLDTQIEFAAAVYQKKC